MMAERERLVTKTNEFDVLLGRGKGTNNRPGNIYFRQLASERALGAEASNSSVRNKEIAREIIHLIERKGGRFLRPVTATNAKGEVVGAWEVVSEESKLAKAKQAMRDSSSSRKKQAQTQDSRHQSNRQRPRLPAEMGTTRGQILNEQASVQPRHRELPLALSSAELQVRQQHNLIGQSSHLYLPQDGARSASLLDLPPALPTTHSYSSMVSQARANQQRFLLQEELTRYRQRQLELALYQRQLVNLLSSQPPPAAAQLAHPFAQHSHAVPIDRAAASFNMTNASLQHHRESSSVEEPHAVGASAAARKRDAQELDSEEEDSLENERKPKAIRVIPPLQHPTSNRSQALPSVAIEPFGAALHPSSPFLDNSPVARQNILPLIEQGVAQRGGGWDLSMMTTRSPEDEKSSSSSGSKESPTLSSSVTTRADSIRE